MFVFFFFKQKTAYEITVCLEFRRVLFRSFTIRIEKAGVIGCQDYRAGQWDPFRIVNAPVKISRIQRPKKMPADRVDEVHCGRRSEERRVGKECRAGWAPYK